MKHRLGRVFENEEDETAPTRGAIIEVLEALGRRSFASARDSLADLATAVAKTKATALTENNRPLADACLVATRYITALKSIVDLWGAISSGQYRSSWDHLQDALRELRWVSEKSEDQDRYWVEALEDQLTPMVGLYPYGLFMSIEVLVKRKHCALCGQPPLSPACEHLPGEIYWGEEAYWIADEIQFLSASLVRDPMDPRCAVEVDDPRAFDGIKVLAEGLDSPLRAFSLVHGTRNASESEFQGLEGAAPCPCGSGTAFERCCQRKEVVEVPHIYIVPSGLLRVEA